MIKFCKKCSCDTERYLSGGCKVCVRAKNTAWAMANKDAINARSRVWNSTNATKKRATNAAYRSTQQEQINLRRKSTRQSNPALEIIKSAVRRARKLASPGTLSKGVIAMLLTSQNNCCACCGAALNGVYHLDHIMPLSLGGANCDDNVQLLLPKCNLQKYNTHPAKFLARRAAERLRAV